VLNKLPDAKLMVSTFNNVRTPFILDQPDQLNISDEAFKAKLFQRQPLLVSLSKSLFQEDQSSLKDKIFS